MKKPDSYLVVLLKDVGTLLGYGILFVLLVGCVQYSLYLATHWNTPGNFGSDEKSLGQMLLNRIAETVVLLAFFAKRRTLRLNYKRILRIRSTRFLKGNQGFGYAALSIFFITGVMMAFGAVKLSYNPNFSTANILLCFLLFIAVGFNEEFLMRGIWLEYLLKRHSTFVAVTISSLVFAALHLGNDNITLLAFINLILAGITLAQLYLFTKNIWLAAFFHLGWNFFQGPVLGFAVSGFPMQSIFFQSPNTGQILLNGGTFGLEGSVIETVVGSLMSVGMGVALWRAPKKHGSCENLATT
jgi:membrane protease YdiL (CAAX protease family)